MHIGRGKYLSGDGQLFPDRNLWADQNLLGKSPSSVRAKAFLFKARQILTLESCIWVSLADSFVVRSSYAFWQVKAKLEGDAMSVLCGFRLDVSH